MNTFLDPLFYFQFFYFLFAVFLAFFIPGDLAIKRLSLSFSQRIIVALVVGCVLWAYQGFFFGLVGMRWATYVYLFVTCVIWGSQHINKKILYSTQQILKKVAMEKIIIVLIGCGTLIQLLTAFYMGIQYSDGVYFCCGIPDSFYHIALTNELIKNMPPFEPGMSGVVVHNYHYLSNLIAADLIRIFNLPLIATQYQYLLLLFSMLIGLSAMIFSGALSINKKYTYWLVFFLYFCGDCTYLLTFILGKGFNIHVPFLYNAATLWFSPPRAYAIVIFFIGLFLFQIWIKKKNSFAGILMAVVMASLIGIKIYFGLFVLSGFAALGLYFLFKKQYKLILPLFLTLGISLCFFLPVNSGSGGLIFTGFWRFDDFIVQPAFGMSARELAREIYMSHNNFARVLLTEIINIFLYFVFVFGTTLLALMQSKKSLSFLSRELHIFLISSIAISLVIGSLFIQRTGGANSSQFLITVYMVSSIYAALACFYWLGKIRGKIIYIAFFMIIALTIPRVIHVGMDGVNAIVNRSGLIIPAKEVTALNFIKNNTKKDAIILVDNNALPKKYTMINNKQIEVPNIDIRHWTRANSYYISFFTDRPLFYDGDSIVLDHGVDTKKRMEDSQKIFQSTDLKIVAKALLKNNIDYIYMHANTTLPSRNSPLFLTQVFRNDTIQILQISKSAVQLYNQDK